MAQTTAQLVNKFVELTRKKDKHETEAGKLKETLEHLEAELVTRFEHAGQQSVKVTGGYTVYLHHQLWGSAKDKDQPRLCAALKAMPELEPMVKESVNTQTFSAWIREQAANYKAGQDDPAFIMTPDIIIEKVLPESLRECVAVTEKISIRARKG